MTSSIQLQVYSIDRTHDKDFNCLTDEISSATMTINCAFEDDSSDSDYNRRMNTIKQSLNMAYRNENRLSHYKDVTQQETNLVSTCKCCVKSSDSRQLRKRSQYVWLPKFSDTISSLFTKRGFIIFIIFIALAATNTKTAVASSFIVQATHTIGGFGLRPHAVPKQVAFTSTKDNRLFLNRFFSKTSLFYQNSTLSITNLDSSWEGWYGGGYEQYFGISTATPVSEDPQSKQTEATFTIYCDLDGVLVDFEHGVRKLFPDIECSSNVDCPIQDLKRRGMLWRSVEDDGSFFENLPWASGGSIIWKIIHKVQRQRRQPLHILTGVPPYVASRSEKFRWCQRELQIPVRHVDMAGPLRMHVPGNWGLHELEVLSQKQDNKDDNKCDQDYNDVCDVITCWSERKHHQSRPGAVLIDDRIELKDAWVRNGGIFIHHKTGDPVGTIEQLLQHGIVSYDDVKDVGIDMEMVPLST